MTAIRPSSLPPDSSLPSPAELVRPGSPPMRVITPGTVHLLALWNEASPRDVMSNYASRAIHLHGEVLIGGIAAETVADLALDRQQVADFVDDDVASMTISITARATNLTDGAGIRLVDFRRVTPTSEQLAEMIADRSVVGALLSHSRKVDEARPSWRLVLKPEEIRRRERLDLVELTLSPARKRGIGASLTGLELTARQLAQLVAALGALATAIIALLKQISGA